MATDALEEKIYKIRLQNEEIRRRYEEVEADKKNAAKQNALVQLVPSDDWPERKEPPEFSAPPRNTLKQKVINKEQNDRLTQHYASVQERLEKKGHKFAPGDGPPPDPKYNFLADSERETRKTEDSQTNDDKKDKGKNKAQRGAPRRRGGGEGKGGSGSGCSRDAYFKDNRGPHSFYGRDDFQPEYEAWRAERNRIDEARINRQKTAEGNWRREWDCNKVNVEREPPRKNDYPRKDGNNYERKNNHYDNDHSNRSHGGGNRTYHGPQKNYGHQEYRRSHQEQTSEYKRQPESKTPNSPTNNRAVAAFDQSIKVTVNQQNQPKGPVMSVKVNSPSIAGTGRVGPRQKSRITYSSQQSDQEVMPHEMNSFTRQKSFDEKTAATNLNNGPKPGAKSPFSQRKREGNPKSPYFVNDKNAQKSVQPQKSESKDLKQPNNYNLKSQRVQKRIQNSEKNNQNVSHYQGNTADSHSDSLKYTEVFHKEVDDNPEYSLNEIQDTYEKISDIEVNINEIQLSNENSYNATSPNDDGSIRITQNDSIDEIIENTQINNQEIKVEKIDNKQNESQTTLKESEQETNNQNPDIQKVEEIEDDNIILNIVSHKNEKTINIENVKLNEEKSIEIENKPNEDANISIQQSKLIKIEKIENSKPAKDTDNEIDVSVNKNIDDSGFGDDSTLDISSEQEKLKDSESESAYLQTESINENDPADHSKDTVSTKPGSNDQEVVESNSMGATKENRKEKIENCDNNSAASNETSETINKEEIQNTEKILGNPTKDNDVITVVASSDADTQKLEDEKKDSTNEQLPNITTDVRSSN